AFVIVGLSDSAADLHRAPVRALLVTGAAIVACRVLDREVAVARGGDCGWTTTGGLLTRLVAAGGSGDIGSGSTIVDPLTCLVGFLETLLETVRNFSIPPWSLSFAPSDVFFVLPFFTLAVLNCSINFAPCIPNRYSGIQYLSARKGSQTIFGLPNSSASSPPISASRSLSVERPPMVTSVGSASRSISDTT